MKQLERYYWPPAAPDAVERALATAALHGQLVEVRRHPAPDGLVAVEVTLRPQLRPGWPLVGLDEYDAGQLAHAWIRADRRRRARRWLLCSTVTAGLVALGAVGWAVWLAVAWVSAHLPHIIGAAAGLAAVWALLGQLGACPGVHCPGCSCGG